MDVRERQATSIAIKADANYFKVRQAGQFITVAGALAVLSIIIR